MAHVTPSNIRIQRSANCARLAPGGTSFLVWMLYLLAVLVASASYIVVPAVVRYAIPEANPAYDFGMALAITFPFNIAVGLPLYLGWVRALWP